MYVVQPLRWLAPTRKINLSPFSEVGDAMRPAAEAYGNTMTHLVNEFFAGSKKRDGRGRPCQPQAQDQRAREANRGVRRTMKECIKLGNVIDDDVKGCIEGLRTKVW